MVFKSQPQIGLILITLWTKLPKLHAKEVKWYSKRQTCDTYLKTGKRKL